MKVDYLLRALKALEDAPAQVRKAFFKQATFLEQNLQHCAPKNTMRRPTFGRTRVKQDWRFYFHIVGDIYLIRDIIPHPKK